MNEIDSTALRPLVNAVTGRALAPSQDPRHTPDVCGSLRIAESRIAADNSPALSAEAQGRRTMPDTISALIVDDHELFRGGLKLLLLDVGGIGVVDEVGSFDEAYEAVIRGLTPDLVTFDLSMPGLSGLEGLSAIIEALPAARVVVMAGSEARADILGALGAGAHGYIPKSLPAEQAAEAIQQVLSGQIYAPSALQRAARMAPAPVPAPTTPLNGFPFTSRQRSVVDLLLTGAPTRKIASKLGLAEGTVKIHLAAIYRIVGVNSRAEVIAKLK